MPGTVLGPGEYGSRNWWFSWGDKKPNKSNTSWLGYWYLYSFPRAILTKYHNLEGLATEIIISKFWRLEVPNQGVGRVGSFFGLWGRIRGPREFPWLVGGILLVSSFPLSSVYVCFCVQISSFGKNTIDIGLWSTLMIAFSPDQLQRPNFQIRLHSQALGIRTSTSFGGT